jgi:DNA invertase Pin-like site-specific DNA recombinase
MPQVFAYLRVSTDAQDVDNQRHGVTRYCVEKKLLAPVFIEDTASGRTDWHTRPLGQIIDRAAKGDVIVVSEVSRLARNTLQVLEIGRECIARGVHLHVAKNGIVFDDTMQSKIISTVLALVAEIERDFISARTKEALAKRRADGVKLGRPEGPAKQLKLDRHAGQIDDYLKRGLQKRSIAKLLDVTPATLYTWLSARRPNTPIKKRPANQGAQPGPEQATTTPANGADPAGSA